MKRHNVTPQPGTTITEASLQQALAWKPAPARTTGSDIDWPIWWITFLSLTCFNIAIGTSVALMMMFLAVWIVYFLAWPARGADHMARTLLPWLFPLLTLASTAWSYVPVTTLRNAIQMLIITGIGILIARAQNARSFISAFMCMMLISVAVGLAMGGVAAVGIRGDTALVGIFGSKNNFALMISFAMLSSAAVFLDKDQKNILRIIGFFGCIVSPPILLLAKSLGAIITLFIALSFLGIFTLAGRLSPRMRPLFYCGVVLLAIIGLGVVLLVRDSGMLEVLLQSAGKDTSLTGRTYLWARAESLIPLHPVFGVGYQAFWVRESVEAEGLWRFSLVTSRFGFHFHNLYYETAIETGYLGVALLGTTLVSLSVAGFLAAIRRPSAPQAFFTAVIVLLGARASVELDFIAPFAIGTLLIPIVWSYCTQTNGVRSVPRHRLQGVPRKASGSAFA